ncbi:MAG TPA: hypothetical protein VGO03_13950 [Acidimicrobiia bacterium]|jgi:hypothetical protein
MPEPIESQLRALAQRLDDAVEPVRADEVMVAEMTPSPRHRTPANTGRAFAAVVALAAIVTGIVVVARHSTHGTPTMTPTTTSTTQPAPSARLAKTVAALEIPFDQTPIVAVFTNEPAWTSFWAPARVPPVDFTRDFALIIDTGDCTTFNGVHVVGLHASVAFTDNQWGCALGSDGGQLDRYAESLPLGLFGAQATIDGPALPTPLHVNLADHSNDGYARVQLHGGALPRMQCLFAHGSPPDVLQQPITLTLPGAKPVPIYSGYPVTRTPNAVTLDDDFSIDPGNPVDRFAQTDGLYPSGSTQTTPVVLDGATTPGGPFEHIDQLRPGQVITIAQNVGPAPCVQHWRVFAQLGSRLGSSGRPKGPLELILEGPNIYVDAVPAS